MLTTEDKNYFSISSRIFFQPFYCCHNIGLKTAESNKIPLIVCLPKYSNPNTAEKNIMQNKTRLHTNKNLIQVKITTIWEEIAKAN